MGKGRIKEKFQRLFIAVPVSLEVKERACKLIEAAKASSLDIFGSNRITWCRPEQLHVTLIFLGEIYPRWQRPLQAIIQDVAREIPPFLMVFSGLGIMPSLARPRLIFARVTSTKGEGSAEQTAYCGGDKSVLEGEASQVPVMTMLHQRLAHKIRALGVSLESRPFIPHLTLGRIRQGRLSPAGERWLMEKADADLGSSLVESVHLMESQLNPKGSLYSSRYQADLGQEKSPFIPLFQRGSP